MKVYEDGNDIVIEELTDFDLEQTLECGQCFHFTKLGSHEYGLAAYQKLLHARQTKEELRLFDVSMEEFCSLWKEYFDLDRDYGAIKSFLLERDGKLKEAVETMSGVRILNQEFFETLISFIISQNKQIPHIKQIVNHISSVYGTFLGEIGSEKFYAFPDVETMRELTEAQLRDCKVGFRAPYIRSAVELVGSGAVCPETLKTVSLEACRQQLMAIHGVGGKVANCVMLFGLGRREAFPVDVWIKRVMEYLYFDKADMPKEKIEQFAQKQFGSYGGYAQQYLFYYGKTVQMGVKNIMKI